MEERADASAEPRPNVWLTFPRIILPAAVFAVVLMLPSLTIGFALDDYPQIGLIEGWYDFETPAVNLYASFLDLPSNPWWTSPESRVAFWRPLPSALFRLDHALFGRSAFFYHLHSLLWLAALIAACGLLYARLPAGAGAAALFFFAADEAHAFTSGVICNRHAVVTSVPALLALYAHLRWREDGWRPGRALAVFGFGVAFVAGETALALAAYVLAYELFAGPGGGRTRLRAIAPFAALTLVYVLAYKAMEMGPRYVGFYLNPLEQPADYLLALVRHLPALLAGALAAAPASMWVVPEFQWPLIAAGMVAVAVFAWILRLVWPRLSDAERRALRWWLPGALAALLPVATTHPSDRQLLVPMVGFAVLLGILAAYAWRRWRDPAAGRRRRRAAACGLALIVLLHLGVASASRVGKLYGVAELGAVLEDVAATIPELAPEASREEPWDLVLIAAGDLFTIIYPQLIYDYHHGAGKVSWRVLSTAPTAHRLTRTAADTVILEPEGQLLQSEWEKIWGPDKLETGDVVEHDAFTVTVLDTNASGPTRLEFRFAGDLDRSRVALLVWRDGGPRRLAPPTIGESVRVEKAGGIFGLL